MTSFIRSILLAVAAVSVLTAAVATGWLAGVLPNPLVAPDNALALLIVSPAGAAVLVLAGASLSLVGSLVLLARAGSDLRLLVPVGVVQLVVFGLAVQGISAISLLGYLVALALPAALVLLGVQVVRRYPRLRAMVAVAALAIAGWGVTTGVFAPNRLRQLGANLAGGFAASSGQLLASLLCTALAAGWAALLVDAVRRTRTGDPGPAAWVLRHRVAVTVVAALGPVPYTLARATWLTPWPQFGGPVDEMGPEIRLWGLLLGGGALLGTVLTLGLIRPWGEVFPRWMPGLAGRPVPVGAAAIPGGLVAAVLCLSAVPMLVAMLTATAATGTLDRVLSVVVFPFWIWGPALALAVWGYVAHRSAARTRVLAG